MTVTVSLPNELVCSLKKAAEYLDRSQSYVVKKAVEFYLKELAWEMEEDRIAHERSLLPDSEYVSTEEFFELVKQEREEYLKNNAGKECIE
jgi:predicted transcriptional regulator